MERPKRKICEKQDETYYQDNRTGSIAEELELEPGDELLRVNGEIIEDVFDYHFQTNDTYLELTIRKKDGEEWDLEIEKEYDEEIGITFENEFMDQYRSCSNNCIFCFIDQMPARECVPPCILRMTIRVCPSCRETILH